MTLRVKEIAKEKGVKLKDIADTLGIMGESLSRMIGKNGNPTIDTLQKIADALEVDLSELIGNKNEEPIYKKDEDGNLRVIGYLKGDQ